jgi:hypothetical protein
MNSSWSATARTPRQMTEQDDWRHIAWDQYAHFMEIEAPTWRRLLPEEGEYRRSGAQF